MVKRFMIIQLLLGQFTFTFQNQIEFNGVLQFSGLYKDQITYQGGDFRFVFEDIFHKRNLDVITNVVWLTPLTLQDVDKTVLTFGQHINLFNYVIVGQEKSFLLSFQPSFEFTDLSPTGILFRVQTKYEIGELGVHFLFDFQTFEFKKIYVDLTLF